jgi:hypothetical protein
LPRINIQNAVADAQLSRDQLLRSLLRPAMQNLNGLWVRAVRLLEVNRITPGGGAGKLRKPAQLAA